MPGPLARDPPPPHQASPSLTHLPPPLVGSSESKEAKAQPMAEAFQGPSHAPQKGGGSRPAVARQFSLCCVLGERGVFPEVQT